MNRFLHDICLWLRIIRPQTLFASVVPVLIGICAVQHGQMPLTTSHPGWVAAITVVCALSLQVLSNLINDYYDFVRGTDKAGRQGFRRALAEGEVSEASMHRACMLALAVSVVCGAFLVWEGGMPILLIGLSAILFAWLYTATDHSLSYLGIADIFVFLYYGVVASSGTVWLLTHTFSLTPFYAGAACGVVSMSVLMINNLRDMDDDRVAGKRTLPVRFGKPACELLLLAEMLLLPLFAWLAFCKVVCWLLLIPGMALFGRVVRANGRQYNRCLLFAGLLNVVYYLLCLIA